MKYKFGSRFQRNWLASERFRQHIEFLVFIATSVTRNACSKCVCKNVVCARKCICNAPSGHTIPNLLAFFRSAFFSQRKQVILKPTTIWMRTYKMVQNRVRGWLLACTMEEDVVLKTERERESDVVKFGSSFAFVSFRRSQLLWYVCRRSWCLIWLPVISVVLWLCQREYFKLKAENFLYQWDTHTHTHVIEGCKCMTQLNVGCALQKQHIFAVFFFLLLIVVLWSNMRN